MFSLVFLTIITVLFMCFVAAYAEIPVWLRITLSTVVFVMIFVVA